ncbi:MAG: DNA repair exonuclease [Pirellulaceae bacterium]
MPIRIMATADIHIGRRPTRIARSEEASRFSAASMWEDVVERAVEEHVDLVALAGDIVDHDNRFFEATGPLERGLAKLARHEIHTLAVAGNHDFDVFPRVAELVGSDWFQLLGQGGKWEEAWCTGADGEQLRVHGWSFPEAHVPTSPLADYRMRPSEKPTLGLLHADLEVPDSVYAPVTRADLNSTPVTLWLLGHIHGPDYRRATEGPHLLYPGSPQPLDPGEAGPHGPWLIEISGSHQVTARHLAMSRVRYEQLQVDLTGIDTKAAFESHVSRSVRDYLDHVADTSQTLEYLSLRLGLTGRTPLFSEMSGWLEPLTEQLERTAGRVRAGVDKVFNHARPELDLDELARKRDLRGALARLLLQLQAGELDDDSKTLLVEVGERMRDIHGSPQYATIDRDEVPGEEMTRERLVHQGMLLLEALRAQEVRE